MELMVLISETASAPPFLAARAGAAHVGDVGRQFDDDGQLAVLLAPARDHLDVLRHLADGGAHAPFRHAVRAAEIELDAVGAGRFHLRQDLRPQRFLARQHQRDDHGAVRPVLLDLGDFAQIDFQAAVGDQLDVIEADHFAVLAVVGRVARGDVDGRRVFAQGLPHHAAPPCFEGADDVVGLVGGRRRGEPEGIGRLDAAEVDAQVGHAAPTLVWMSL